MLRLRQRQIVRRALTTLERHLGKRNRSNNSGDGPTAQHPQLAPHAPGNGDNAHGAGDGRSAERWQYTSMMYMLVRVDGWFSNNEFTGMMFTMITVLLGPEETPVQAVARIL